MHYIYKRPKLKVIFQNNFPVGADKIFQPKCILPDAEDITVSSSGEALRVFAVI